MQTRVTEALSQCLVAQFVVTHRFIFIAELCVTKSLTVELEITGFVGDLYLFVSLKSVIVEVDTRIGNNVGFTSHDTPVKLNFEIFDSHRLRLRTQLRVVIITWRSARFDLQFSVRHHIFASVILSEGSLGSLPNENALKPVLFARFFLQVWIPAVFNLVIIAAGHKLGNLRPAWPMLVVKTQDFLVLLDRPLFLCELWTQNVDPALATLLVDTIWQCLAHLLPVFWPVHGHLLGKNFVLLWCPGELLSVVLLTADKLQIPFMALDHRLEQELADAAPLLPIHLHALKELNVFLLIEVLAWLLDIVALAPLLFLLIPCVFFGLHLRPFLAFAGLHCLCVLDDLSLPLCSSFFGARNGSFTIDGDLTRSIRVRLGLATWDAADIQVRACLPLFVEVCRVNRFFGPLNLIRVMAFSHMGCHLTNGRSLSQLVKVGVAHNQDLGHGREIIAYPLHVQVLRSVFSSDRHGRIWSRNWELHQFSAFGFRFRYKTQILKVIYKLKLWKEK